MNFWNDNGILILDFRKEKGIDRMKTIYLIIVVHFKFMIVLDSNAIDS